MPIVKLTLSEEYHQKLVAMANAANRSIQDYIRDQLFGKETMFTPEEAVRRILDGAVKEKEKIGFTLPDVYGDDWTIQRGPAGVFGKQFFNYTDKHPDLGIRFKDMGPHGRRAVYTYQDPTQNS